MLGSLLMCIVVVSGVCGCVCVCVCVLVVGSVVAGLLGLLLGWFVMFIVLVFAVCVWLLALLSQGFLGYCWAGC
jgi:hypothetical protein